MPSKSAQSGLGRADFVGDMVLLSSAPLMDVQIEFSMEDCVGGMEQKSKDVPSRDVQIKSRMEEYASSTVQSVLHHHAVRKGALIFPSEEECVRGMEPRPLDAAEKDARMEPSKEEFVFDMGHNLNSAVTMGAPIKLYKEVFAVGTGQR